MYNQEPTIRRVNFSFSDPEEQDPSEKPKMGQPVPPPYQEQPNAGYPESYPNLSGYPSQPYGAPGDPQGPYTQQQPYPPNAGHTGVTAQPTVFMISTPASVHMPDYLCYSIFTLLCCCFPLGIAAVIYSASTQNANMAGQQDLASRSSRTTLILNNVALGIGLAVYILTIILSLNAYGVFK
ncbi:interferon-induced transmembrane protein 3-like [Chanodichthys erythropterus]|uniref:interferon-induced transmembrane protein 3-like n=1 Tax=Chanodichthys erythropterus TaxID=933992 RepID=UPI00351DC9AC